MRTLALLSYAALLLAPVAALAQASPIAAATAGLRQVQQAYGRGAQLYSCQPVNGSPAFVYLGPDALLYQFPNSNSVEQVATHSIGPVWQWNDGSGVFGTTTQTIPSQDPNNIPSLVLSAQPFGTHNGVLSSVSTIVRSSTTGGTAPSTGCDTVHIGTIARVPYTATYTFLAPGTAASAK